MYLPDMYLPEVYIFDAIRTPIGCFKGQLSAFSATDLGGYAISEAAKGLHNKELIEQVIMGNVLSAGLGQAPARQAALKAGLGNHIGCTLVNKVCGSGMKAVIDAFDHIRAGSSSLVVAGGMESMTQAPHLIPGYRQHLSTKDSNLEPEQFIDSLFYDGLQDPFEGELMGTYAQRMADRFNITRAQMDEYALASYERAAEAHNSGDVNHEIAPIIYDNRQQIISEDEVKLVVDSDKLKTLKPAFTSKGTITAANSSTLADGAAALLIGEQGPFTSDLAAKARIVGHAHFAAKPSDYPLAPIHAINRLLQKTGWHMDDVDLFEINEAFALVPLLAMQFLSIPHHKLNIYGGACALGHPIGCSGARILVTLLNALTQIQSQRGIAAVCIGGGEATAIAIERV